MLKIEKVVLGLLALLIGAAVIFPVFTRNGIYYLEQPRQRKLQAIILNASFSGVQKQGAGVLLKPARYQRLMKSMAGLSFGGPQPFLIGSRFQATDRHWSAIYTISSIESHGVTIHYDASSGSSYTNVKPSKGDIKIAWKQNPPRKQPPLLIF